MPFSEQGARSSEQCWEERRVSSRVKDALPFIWLSAYDLCGKRLSPINRSMKSDLFVMFYLSRGGGGLTTKKRVR